MNKNVKMQKKVNGKWETIAEYKNPFDVYDGLVHELISKKLEGVTYITRIQRIQKYNGSIEIIVTFIGGLRKVYTVKSH